MSESMNTATASDIGECVRDDAIDEKSRYIVKSSYENHISGSHGGPDVFDIHVREIISSSPEWNLREPIGDIGSESFVPWVIWWKILDRKCGAEVHDRIISGDIR